MTVNLQVGGAATAGLDYLPIANQTTIPKYKTFVDVTLYPLKDFLVESGESVALTLMPGTKYFTEGNITSTINISDGLPPEHVITVQPASRLGCEDSGKAAVFAVFRSNGRLAAPLTVDFSIGGTAVEGTDYSSLTRQVTIQADADFATVVVNPLSDGVSDEGPETVTLTAASGANYTVGDPDDAMVHILDTCVGTDSTGTDFWLLFPRVGFDNPEEIRPTLTISGPTPATGTVAIPGIGFSKAFSVVPGSVVTVELPPDALVQIANSIQGKGIHVTASQPVSVYGLSYGVAVSEAFCAFPTPMLGLQYCVMARPSHFEGFPDLVSQLAVVATEDNTQVSITPSVTANLSGHPGTATFNVTLQRWQVYQLGSVGAYNDVTGTLIVSTKPVGVFAGASLARVPDAGTVAGNPLIEMQLPVSSWGRQTFGLPLANRVAGDTYRVLAATDNTVVAVNGTIAASLAAGQFYDARITGPVEFRANNPIQVAHFSNGSSIDNELGYAGDPFMILLPAAGHYLDSYIVSTPTNAAFTGHYLHIFVEQSALASTLVDGKLVTLDKFKPLGRSGYYGAQLPVESGPHTVSSSKPVGAYVYGFGTWDGYGYIGGIATFPLAAIPDYFSVPLNTTRTLNVLVNDIISSLEDVVLTIVAPPGSGVATVTTDKKITYVPAPDYSGNAELTYSIEEQGHISTTTVKLTVNGPLAVDDQALVCNANSVSIPVLENDSSPNQTTLKVIAAQGSQRGRQLMIQPDNTIIYYPDPTDVTIDQFSYEIEDERGARATATVLIYSPVATADHANVFEGQSVIVRALDNDGSPSVVSHK